MISKHIRLYLLLLFSTLLSAKVVIENGSGKVKDRWRVIVGNSDDIKVVFDEELNSSVIEFEGGGSYKLGATEGERALNIKGENFISWQMRVEVPYTIYIIANTKFGLRYIFYVSTHSRGLLHGLENGIHHGLGKTTLSGRWIRITRDLQRDIKDAEPDNELISINGFIFNGGNGARIDNIIAYTPQEITYLSKEKSISTLEINNSKYTLFEWSFRGFGESEIIDTRGTIKNPDAFEFIIGVDTKLGKRKLLYKLGEESLGLIDTNTIHHALGDDRTVGSVWVEDYPKNKLGLWQGELRDLQEDIRDFERDNSLIRVDYFRVKGDGKVKDIKMFSGVDMRIDDENSSIDECPESSTSGIGLESSYILYLGLIYILVIFFRKEIR